MAHRIVTDRAGSAWQVWAVRPTPRAQARSAAVAPEYRQGWLAFERLDPVAGAGTATPSAPGHPPEKRRLVPIPPAWEEVPDATLLGLLVTATPVTPAAGRPRPSTATPVAAPAPR